SARPLPRGAAQRPGTRRDPGRMSCTATAAVITFRYGRSARVAASPSIGRIVAGLLAVGLPIAAWSAWASVAEPRAKAAPAAAPSPLVALQQDVIARNVGKASDPMLALLYGELSVRHFAGMLRGLSVRWEPRLAEAGARAGQSFTLEGLFGHLGTQSVI